MLKIWLPSSVLDGKSPFELVYGLKLKLSHLRSFGCLCFSSVLDNFDKFSSRSEKYVLNLNFFDKKHYDNQTSLSSNDDGRGDYAPNDEDNVYPCTRSP
ncbi:hypothetical protein Tco_0042846 [Tanacetum coccineum]